MVELCRGAVAFIGKPLNGIKRLGVLLQTNAFNSLPSVLVCPIPGSDVDAPFLRVRLDPSDALPLQFTMWAMAELMTAIPKSEVGTVIGHMSSEQQKALDRSIIMIAGIA